MDARLLRSFVAVFEERSMTAAAERCYVSQPSLSSAIKQLESELEVQLFVRHKRGVDLTDQAHHLYPMAVQTLGQLNRMSKLFAEQPASLPIKLANFEDLSPSLLAEFIQHCKSQQPLFNFELLDHQDKTAQARLTLDVFKQEDELFIPLWQEDYVLCVPQQHPLAQQQEVEIAELNNYDFIECVVCEAHQQTLSLLASQGFAVNLVAKAQHKTQVKHLVNAGIGISFLPTGVLETAANLQQVKLLAPRMYRSIGLCVKASASAKPELAALINAANNWSERNQGN
ncbi:LysR family transcriptional regulator [Agarivorans aestuarii]|uniref:LysR family transcriptional regulator n=1 Tax=Agarivorans aestuarii TaxID=1563703 RepID=A0ABU7FZM8_9ALTE|nr:LysR family transcriptional regulator [Agarivorans aestuarii]MEE1672612.1 LysR family transcriptional regulator [Agarivorans aestuarii]